MQSAEGDLAESGAGNVIFAMLRGAYLLLLAAMSMNWELDQELIFQIFHVLYIIILWTYLGKN